MPRPQPPPLCPGSGVTASPLCSAHPQGRAPRRKAGVQRKPCDHRWLRHSEPSCHSGGGSPPEIHAIGHGQPGLQRRVVRAAPVTLCFEQRAPHTSLLRPRVGAPPHCRCRQLALRCLQSFSLGLCFLGHVQGLGPRGLSVITCGEFGCALVLPICCRVSAAWGPSRAVSSRAELPWSFLGFPCSPGSIPPSQCRRPPFLL